MILISNDRTSASKKILGMALIRTLMVLTIAFERTKENSMVFSRLRFSMGPLQAKCKSSLLKHFCAHKGAKLNASKDNMLTMSVSELVHQTRFLIKSLLAISHIVRLYLSRESFCKIYLVSQKRHEFEKYCSALRAEKLVNFTPLHRRGVNLDFQAWLMTNNSKLTELRALEDNIGIYVETRGFDFCLVHGLAFIIIELIYTKIYSATPLISSLMTLYWYSSVMSKTNSVVFH